MEDFENEMREECVRVWHAYETFASSSAVRRIGYQHIGITRESGGVDGAMPDVCESFKNRGESILEHGAKVAWLALALIGSKNLNIFKPFHTYDTCLWSAITVALCHDVGECEIGDIPDDGNDSHNTKDVIELKFFKKFVDAYASPYKDYAKCDFEDFQHKYSQIGMAIYALDKLEALLTLLFYEKRGLQGAMDSKPYFTDLDKYYMFMTDSMNATDCWAAHSVSLIRGFPVLIKEPILTLLDVAVRDVRGKPFSWWDEYIPPFKKSLSS